MDYLDDAKAAIVRAMAHLEQALEDGLPAQAPASSCEEVATGIRAFRAQIDAALACVAEAEAALERDAREGG